MRDFEWLVKFRVILPGGEYLSPININKMNINIFFSRLVDNESQEFMEQDKMNWLYDKLASLSLWLAKFVRVLIFENSVLMYTKKTRSFKSIILKKWVNEYIKYSNSIFKWLSDFLNQDNMFAGYYFRIVRWNSHHIMKY